MLVMVSVMKMVFDPDYRRLVGWLAAERRYKKLSQPNLAAQLGYASHSYISKIETFERKLDLVEFVKICKILELDPHEGIAMLITSD